MAAHDWGLDQPPHPASQRTDDVDGLTSGQLPEVRELVAEGWELAPDAPLWAFLPAVWPVGLRTWIPDRAAYYEQHYRQDPVTYEVLWSATARATAESRAEVDDDLDEILAEAGITGRPRGRLWLLKPPPGFASVEAFLDEWGRRRAAAGVDLACCPEMVEFTARMLRDLAG